MSLVTKPSLFLAWLTTRCVVVDNEKVGDEDHSGIVTVVKSKRITTSHVGSTKGVCGWVCMKRRIIRIGGGRTIGVCLVIHGN